MTERENKQKECTKTRIDDEIDSNSNKRTEAPELTTEQKIEKIITYFDTKKIRRKRFRKSICYLKRLPSAVDENLDMVFVNIFKLKLSDDEKCYLYTNMVDLIFLMDEPKILADRIYTDASSNQKCSFLACKCLFILVTEYNFYCSDFLDIFMGHFDQQITKNTEEMCDFVIQIVNRMCLSFADASRLVNAMKQHLLSFSSGKTYVILNAMCCLMRKHVLLHEKLVKSNKFWELDVLEHSIEPIKCLAQAVKYNKAHNFQLNYDEEVERVFNK